MGIVTAHIFNNVAQNVLFLLMYRVYSILNTDAYLMDLLGLVTHYIIQHNCIIAYVNDIGSVCIYKFIFIYL